MAQNARFGLSLRILTLLAHTPDGMTTSAAIASALGTNPVMVRRIFAALHRAGFLIQRKGPQGGVKLKVPAKSIRLGDLYAAVANPTALTGDKSIDAILARVHEDTLSAMNETTIATITKKQKKS